MITDFSQNLPFCLIPILIENFFSNDSFQAKASDEAKPTLGDANKTLQDLKDKMDGKK